MKLDGIQYEKCNDERTVTGAKNIRTQIEFQLDFWNHGAFDKLLNDTYTADTGTCGELTGSKVRSNIFLHFRILLYVEIFAWQSDLSPNMKQEGGWGGVSTQ